MLHKTQALIEGQMPGGRLSQAGPREAAALAYTSLGADPPCLFGADKLLGEIDGSGLVRERLCSRLRSRTKT